jgi:hypothetical protein
MFRFGSPTYSVTFGYIYIDNTFVFKLLGYIAQYSGKVRTGYVVCAHQATVTGYLRLAMYSYSAPNYIFLGKTAEMVIPDSDLTQLISADFLTPVDIIKNQRYMIGIGISLNPGYGFTIGVKSAPAGEDLVTVPMVYPTFPNFTDSDTALLSNTTDAYVYAMYDISPARWRGDIHIDQLKFQHAERMPV